MEITEESIIKVFESSKDIRKKFHIYEILNALGGNNYSKDSDIFSDTSEANLSLVHDILLAIEVLEKEKHIVNTEFINQTLDGEVCNLNSWEEVFMPIALGKANFDHFQWLIELNLH